jgi:aminoglycoside phosphotransferase family enzyme/predicted kinase
MITFCAPDGDPGAASTGFSPTDLLRPSAFPHPVTLLQLHETNISWVILTGLYAYKIKKCVQLGFIDTTTLARRRFLCEEELRLNRRLAPDLYVDVVAITRDAAGLSVAGEGPIVEYAVRMKQFEASQELSALLDRDAVSAREFIDLAQRLAQFHELAPKALSSKDFPCTQHLHDAVLGNLAILLSHLDADTALPEMGVLIDWTHDYLHDSLEQLRARESSGYIRECHGDLHAHNVVRWRDRLVPFDCLEFDPDLRWIDVMNDAAFLVMDLMARGRKDLACAFLNAYLERTGDYRGVRHLAFYSVYRALVRAMVDSIGAQQDGAHRRDFLARLRARVRAAAAYIVRPAPALFIMHGVSGSGKSWLSEQLASQWGALRIRSDVERKRLGAESPAVASNTECDLYTSEMNRLTYARLLEGAESCLKGGMDTIVDAAFLNGDDRRMFRDLAIRLGCQFAILACEADPAALARRIETRGLLRTDPSDATVQVLNRQLKNREPLAADEQAAAIRVDTMLPQASEKAIAAIRSRLRCAQPEPK